MKIKAFITIIVETLEFIANYNVFCGLEFIFLERCNNKPEIATL